MFKPIKCSCGKQANYNYYYELMGIKCKECAYDGMVNVQISNVFERFIVLIEEGIGGEVIGDYKGSKERIECICPYGHVCYPMPNSIQRNIGMCQKCAKNDSETAKNNFYTNIQKLGGKVIGSYVNNNTRVECMCSKGHKCNPIPNGVQQGEGMCRICSGNDSETAKSNFYCKIKELGGKVIGQYINSNARVECICSKGHKCNPTSNSIQQRQGMCRICAGNDFETAKSNFYCRIKELEGKVIGEYERSDKGVECICLNGHVCKPRPCSIQQGQGMCKICVNRDPETAKNNFYYRIKKLGGEVIGQYVNSNTRVECMCSKGHKCKPKPGRIQQGEGMCRICAGTDSETAKSNFYCRIKKLGGEVIGEYKGNKEKIECRCPFGHKCNPIPNGVQQGEGMCRICAKHDFETAKNNFYCRIKELDGKVIGEYERSDKGVECICLNGHACKPRPCGIQQGQGMCKICVNRDPETAKNNFYYRIKELGGKVLGEYKKNNKRVECICPKGHKCNPIPNCIQQGGGMCCKCKHKTQAKLLSFLQSIYPDVISEHSPEWLCNPITTYRFRIDFYFYIPFKNMTVIIELDGPQHQPGNQIGSWESFEFTNIKDKLKMQLCMDKCDKFIRIKQEDVWNDTIDWKSSILNAVDGDNKIHYINHNEDEISHFIDYQDVDWIDYMEHMSDEKMYEICGVNTDELDTDDLDTDDLDTDDLDTDELDTDELDTDELDTDELDSVSSIEE